MIDLRRARSGLGRAMDAAAAAGTLHARLAELLARITTTLAGRIDVAVSSRVQASAYTSGRAARLDRIGVTSVQRAEVAHVGGENTTDATITSVVVGKTLFLFAGTRVTDSTAARASWRKRGWLLNSTTVRMVGGAGASSNSLYGAFELVEFR